ncbi:hypothetical protein ACKWTF_011701 [Chironomus riparius]
MMQLGFKRFIIFGILTFVLQTTSSEALVNETSSKNETTKDYEVYKIDLKPLSEVFLIVVGMGLIFAILMTFMIFVLMCACFVCMNKCCGSKKCEHNYPPPRINRERIRDVRNPRDGTEVMTSLMSSA